MDDLVFSEATWSGKSFTTLLTAVWFLSSVDNFVIPKVAWQGEPFTTLFTAVWSLSSVNELVALEVH